VTTGATRRAKLQSHGRQQQTSTQHFTGRTPFLSPNQQRQTTEGKRSPYNTWHTKEHLDSASLFQGNSSPEHCSHYLWQQLALLCNCKNSVLKIPRYRSWSSISAEIERFVAMETSHPLKKIHTDLLTHFLSYQQNVLNFPLKNS